MRCRRAAAAHQDTKLRAGTRMPSPATSVRHAHAFCRSSRAQARATVSGYPPAVAIPTLLPRGGGGLAHGLEVRGAALLQQTADVAMKILHPQTQKLGNERVGTAAPGNTPG